uniref:Uncharacterized protein n=1 Tax=Dulem virus 42 TaxID=3145760 RepID=A0AAU8B896_9CAUD
MNERAIIDLALDDLDYYEIEGDPTDKRWLNKFVEQYKERVERYNVEKDELDHLSDLWDFYYHNGVPLEHLYNIHSSMIDSFEKKYKEGVMWYRVENEDLYNFYKLKVYRMFDKCGE